MMKNKLLLVLLTTSILTSCQNDGGNTQEEAKKENKTTVHTEEGSDEKGNSISDITFKEGEYKATSTGVDGDVEVIVKLSEDKIESIEIGEENETSGIAEPVYETIPQAIVDNQSLAVDNVSGVTITSAAVKSAAAKAIEEGSSKEEVDSLKKVDIPVEIKN